MISVRKVGDWTRAADILRRAQRQMGSAMDRAMLQEGQYLRNQIVTGIREQAPGGRSFKPLSPRTILMRRLTKFSGTKALIRRGDLRNSITVVRQRNAVFVGVHRTARGKKNEPLANVAAVHEYGSRPIVVRITPKMRRLLGAAFGGLTGGRGRGTGIIVRQVPARPFISPVWKKFCTPSDKLGRRIMQRFATNMGGILGTMGGRAPER